MARMGEGRGVYWVFVKKPEGNSSLKRTGIDGRIILKWNLKSGIELVDSIDLGQNGDRWPALALVNAIIILQVP